MYEKKTVAELKNLISPTLYYEKTGERMSKAKKQELIYYLEKYGEDGQSKKDVTTDKSESSSSKDDLYIQQLFEEQKKEKLIKQTEPDLEKILTSKPQITKIPKLEDFKPDETKLQQIREEINLPEPEQENIIEEKKIEISEEEEQILDEDDKNQLRKIIDNSHDQNQEKKNNYKYNQLAENKMHRYCQLYPTLKPILSSTDFKSSEEKLKYMEYIIDSTKFNCNITNLIFATTSYVERNDTINKYVKLRGYTKTLAQRKQELEQLIEELKIKYAEDVGEYLAWPAEARLALLFAQTALDVHLINSQKGL